MQQNIPGHFFRFWNYITLPVHAVYFLVHFGSPCNTFSEFLRSFQGVRKRISMVAATPILYLQSRGPGPTFTLKRRTWI